MQRKNKFIWLAVIFMTFACQILPPSNPNPTQTPTITPGGPTLTPSPTITLTPFPTPVPVARIESGDEALFFGDFESAREQYRSAFDDSNDKALQAAALWGLGRTELADQRFELALQTLATLTNEYPDSTYAARAYFLMGQAHEALGQHQQAADAYNVYSTRIPGVLDAYVQEYRGDALNQIKDYTGAISAYAAAQNASRLDGNLTLQIKIAQARADFGDYAGALTAYDETFASSTNDYIRAQMDYLAGNAHLALGQTDEAYTRYLHTVENYPLSYYSYLALVKLVDANVPVDELDRGLVDYFAAQYDVALAAFDRHIAATQNQVNDGTAQYYRALTLSELQRTQEAIDALDSFIKAFPAHPRWVDAWEEKSFLEWAALNNYVAGAKTLTDFVAAAPNSASAPEFLYIAARITERDNRLEEAAQLWERVANEYPGSEQVPLALFLAGISRYRINDYQGALTTFQRDLLLSASPEDRARAYFWIGKTQTALGDNLAAQESWQQGQAIDSTNYYSTRARDVLLGNQPFQSPPAVNLDIDLAKERKDAEAWMRITFNLPTETDLSNPGALAQDPRFVRGTELWELGMYDEARLEFESLRESVKADPADSFRLANHLLDIGLYRSAVFAAREVLTLAGYESQSQSLTAPPYFNHVRYGLYYHDLVIEQAGQYGLDPLFMFSVIRQESLFEGFVKSTAGAHGLMQIIAPTGAQIAGELGWPLGYKEADLYRPIVSVRYGAYYMNKNRNQLGGNLYAALAAYNGGPGNAIVWNQLAGNDPDLFLEVVRFEETRNYIRFIYEIFNTYKNLYGSPQ
ncbi:MAG: tetratricopeptide repeat protein [Anaerolineales bacterium]|nr:tetratricopeptide repeat protein [Anaerolineales bacterium]